MAQDDVPGGWLARATDVYATLRGRDNAAAFDHVVSVLQRLHVQSGAPASMDPWIDALDAHMAYETSRRGDVDLPLFQAALAVLARRPSHPALPLWQTRALDYLDAPRDATTALRAATFAFEYAVRSGNFPAAREVVERARRHVPHADVAARITWLEAEALEAWLNGEPARAHSAVEAALECGGGYGAWEQGASAALCAGDLSRVDRCLAEMTQRLDPARAQDVAHAAFLSAARARLGGDLEAAHRRIDACLAVDAGAIPLYFVTLWQLGRAYLDIASGKYRRAARDVSFVLARAGSMYWRFLLFSALLARAWLRLRLHRPGDAVVHLDEALALAHAHGYRTCDPWWDPELMADLATLEPACDPRYHAAFALLARRATVP